MSVRSDLLNYQHLLAEVEHLQELIGELEAEKKNLIQTDMVIASETEYPYTQHKVKIRGIDFSEKEAMELNDQYQKLIRKLRRKKVESKRAYIRAMSYIYEAPDVLTRQALEMFCIQGMSWSQIATKIGGVTPDAIRVSCRRYLEGKDLKG